MGEGGICVPSSKQGIAPNINFYLAVAGCQGDICEELFLPEPGEDCCNVGGVVVPFQGVMVIHQQTIQPEKQDFRIE